MKNLPEEGRVSIRAQPEVEASHAEPKTAGRPCAWSQEKKKEIVGDKCDEITGHIVRGFLRPVQDFGFDSE